MSDMKSTDNSVVGVVTAASSEEVSPPNGRQNCPCLSVIIPAYNEEATLAEIVARVLKVPHLLEIVIVDDCSSDGTPEISKELAATNPQVRVTRHKKNSGKTEALKTGIALTKGEFVIIQDADLEYDPTEIPGVMQPLLAGLADVVYGSRFLVRKATRLLYFYHFLANKGLTFMSNMFTNLNMTDVETGYKAFRGEIIRNMKIVSSGFGFEIEVSAKIAKLGCTVYEVPISYYGRTYDEGKKIGFSDGLMAVWLILRFNLFCGLRSSYRTVPKIQPITALSAKKLEAFEVANLVSQRQASTNG